MWSAEPIGHGSIAGLIAEFLRCNRLPTLQQSRPDTDNTFEVIPVVQPSSTIETQIERAKEQLQRVEASLEGKELKKQPKWRAANAQVNQLESRLAAHQQQRGQSSSEE